MSQFKRVSTKLSDIKPSAKTKKFEGKRDFYGLLKKFEGKREFYGLLE